MAFATLVPVQTVSAPLGGMEAVPPADSPGGTAGVSGDVNLPARTLSVQFRLLSDDWLPGGTGVLSWAMDVSDDNGATWREKAPPAQTPEGARDRFGNMPSILWRPERGDYSKRAWRVRVRFAVTEPLRLGVEWERL